MFTSVDKSICIDCSALDLINFHPDQGYEQFLTDILKIKKFLIIFFLFFVDS